MTGKAFPDSVQYAALNLGERIIDAVPVNLDIEMLAAHIAGIYPCCLKKNVTSVVECLKYNKYIIYNI